MNDLIYFHLILAWQPKKILPNFYGCHANRRLASRLVPR